MNHLKLYENYNNIKKYIIWEFPNYHNENRKVSCIFQVIKAEYYFLYVEELYIFDNNSLIESDKNSKQIRYSEREYNEHVLYETDDLQDCIDMLLMLPYINKYNL